MEHELDLPGRGRLTVRDTAGPAGAPVLVLLHGVTLDGELNWSAIRPALSRHHRVLTLDLRGHGRGLPARSPYRLEDCADDVAAVVEALGTGPVVPVGYSMGGMVAQLVWQRHPAVTAGLVLCSTSRNVAGTLWEQSLSWGMPAAVAATRWTRWVPPLLAEWLPVGADSIAGHLLDADLDPAARKAALAQMRRVPLAVALDAMHAVSTFSSHRWIGSVDVPTSVVVTRHDRVVAPHRQRRLAACVPGATLIEIDGDHGVFSADPDGLLDGLLRACAAVTGRSQPNAA